jgi:AmiR/NasT family two-component response regulator
LVSRIVVEQAKGYLRERLDVSTEEAFTLLRHYARTRDVHLIAVAQHLIHGRGARGPILRAIGRSDSSP